MSLQRFKTGDFVVAHLRQQTDLPRQVLTCRVLVAGVAIVGKEQEIDALFIGRCVWTFLHGKTGRTPGIEPAVQQPDARALGFR
ncbi:hypothetical protein D3C84_800410 [compost metagenome]